MDWRNDFRRWKLKNKAIKPVFWFFLFLTLLIGACEKESKIVTLELDIAELICRDGQNIFEGRVLELEGIKAVSVNIQTRKAQVKFRDSLVSESEIKEHLAAFGFTIDGVDGNPVARGRLPQCCLAENSAGSVE